MIPPISVQLQSSTAIANEMTRYNEQSGEHITVELIVLDSGEHKGDVVGYIRYLPIKITSDDDRAEHYPWQVCKRIDHEDNFTHKQTFKSFEQALHSAMACAYDYIANPID